MRSQNDKSTRSQAPEVKDIIMKSRLSHTLRIATVARTAMQGLRSALTGAEPEGSTGWQGSSL